MSVWDWLVWCKVAAFGAGRSQPALVAELSSARVNFAVGIRDHEVRRDLCWAAFGTRHESLRKEKRAERGANRLPIRRDGPMAATSLKTADETRSCLRKFRERGETGPMRRRKTDGPGATPTSRIMIGCIQDAALATLAARDRVKFQRGLARAPSEGRRGENRYRVARGLPQKLRCQVNGR
jgi:hypothetical protein